MTAEDGERGAAVTCDGRLFHRRAAATVNALSPTVDRRVRRRTSRDVDEAECSHRLLVYVITPLRLSRDRDGATAKQLQACIGVSRNDMDTYCATVELATKTQKASASATNSTMHLAPRRLEIGPCRLCKTEVSLKAFFQS